MTLVMQACIYIVATKKYSKDEFIAEFPNSCMHDYFLEPWLEYHEWRNQLFVIVSYNTNFSAS